MRRSISREGNKALLTNETINRKIKLQIDGIDNLELLSIIRYEFESVIDKVSEAHYEERIPCLCNDCKNSGTPHQYEFKFLRKRKNKGNRIVVCPKSADDVYLNELFGYNNIDLKSKSDFQGTTIIEQVNLHGSSKATFGGTSNENKNMKIDKVINEGGQNIFADSIENSTFKYSEVEEQLVEIFKKYSNSEEEQKELESSLEEVRNPESTKDQKLTAKEKVEAFLYKHSVPIGDSIIAAILFEIGKHTFL